MKRFDILVILLAAVASVSLVLYFNPFHLGTTAKPVFQITGLEVTFENIMFNVSNVGKGDAHNVQGTVSFPIYVDNEVEWVPVGGWTVPSIKAAEFHTVSLNVTLSQLAENKMRVAISCEGGVSQEITVDLPQD